MRCIVCMGIVLMMMCLNGCGSDPAADHTERTEEMKVDDTNNVNTTGKPTAQQLQILQDCGLNDSQLQEIQEKGLSASQKSFVHVAEIVLNKLADKYGADFQILGGAIPDLLSTDYTFTVWAVEGEWAFLPFEVTYEADAAGNGVCKEGYFVMTQNQAMQDYLQGIADEEDIEIRVITHVVGQVGDDFTKDCGLAEIKGEDTGITVEIYGLVEADIDEADFMAMCESLALRYKELGYSIGYDVYRVLDSEQIARINNYEELFQIYPQGMRKDTVYDIRYHEYIAGPTSD